MVLPIIEDELHIGSLYPDRIKVNYRYALVGANGLLPSASNPIISGAGLRPVSGKKALSARLSLPDLDISGSAYITRPKGNAPLNVYVEFNPLSRLHRLNAPHLEETPRTAATNWLPANEVRDDNEWVVTSASELIVYFEVQANQLAQEIASAIQNRSFRATVELVGVSVRVIEVSVDISASDPYAYVRKFHPAFRRHFRQTAEHSYRADCIAATDAGSLMLSAFGSDGRFKVYERTDSRIRLECGFDKMPTGISAGITLSEDADDRQTFSELFSALARQALPMFETLRREAVEGLPDGYGPLDFVAVIFAAIKRPAVARELLHHLVRHQRVNTRFDHAVVHRLIKEGLLQSDQRGSAVVSQSYRRAAAELDRMDRRFWGMSGIGTGLCIHQIVRVLLTEPSSAYVGGLALLVPNKSRAA